MIDDETRGKALGRLRRIEGQVQGIQRMVEEDKYCVDILLQLTAVQGAVEQVQKLLLARHISSCVTDAIRSSLELISDDVVFRNVPGLSVTFR